MNKYTKLLEDNEGYSFYRGYPMGLDKNDELVNEYHMIIYIPYIARTQCIEEKIIDYYEGGKIR